MLAAVVTAIFGTVFVIGEAKLLELVVSCDSGLLNELKLQIWFSYDCSRKMDLYWQNEKGFSLSHDGLTYFFYNRYQGITQSKMRVLFT